jgi:hypothetical protein
MSFQSSLNQMRSGRDLILIRLNETGERAVLEPNAELCQAFDANKPAKS